MADRVFPNKLQDGQLASEQEFNGINWASILTKIASDEANDKRTDQFPEKASDILKVLNGLGEGDDKVEKCACSETSDEDTAEKNEVEKQVEESEEEMLRKGKTASTVKKIRFTNTSQLNAEAIVAAKESGDEDLVKAILAARHERRIRIGSKITEASIEQKEINDKIEQRHAYRMKLIGDFETRLAQTEGKKLVAKTAKPVKVAVKVKSPETFKDVTSMCSNERKAFAKRAEALGFPKEYVEQMLGTTAADNHTEDEIRETMAAKLPMNARKAAVAEVVRTAMLDDEQVKRCVKYWKEDLGYGDAEWIDDLFKTKYDSKSAK